MNTSDEEHNDVSKEEEQTELGEDTRSATTIGNEVGLFIRQIDSLAETLPLTMIVIQAAHGAAYEKYEKFVQEHCETESNGDGQTVLIPVDFMGRYKRLDGQIHKALLAHKAVPRSFLVSLISHYDAFLGSLIRNLLLVKPDTLSASERNITFAQLVEFRSIEDAREYVIEKEVETVLRKSHSEQFEWLEAKFGLELRKGLNIWPDFIEVTERRNLFVHNRGIVSNQYLDVCRKHNVSFENEPQVGEELTVPPEYFNSAFECIFEIGVKLAHVLWRKVQSEDRAAADNELIETGLDLLTEERFGLARKVLDFSTKTLKKFSDEQTRLIFVINRAQAYKWSGDAEMSRRILSGEDWSATSDNFRLAEAVLLDDFSKADQLVKRIGPNGNITKRFYRECPLFREYRNSESFQRAFEEVFREPFNLFSVELPETQSLSEGEQFLADELPPLEEHLLEDEVLPLEEHLLEDEQFLEDERPPLGEP